MSQFSDPDYLDYERDGDEYRFYLNGKSIGTFRHQSEQVCDTNDGDFDSSAYMLTSLVSDDGKTLGVAFIDDSRAEAVYGSAYTDALAE